jgi:oligoribonuclease
MGESSCARDSHQIGLIDAIPDGVSLADAEFAVIEYILKFIPAGQHAPLAGA